MAGHGGSETLNLHASCVALDEGAGLLILGPSGAGKSTLALSLMGYGARLVADDRTDLRRQGGALIASAPDSIAGMIEARGLGLLSAEALSHCRISAVVDLSQTEEERLPPVREKALIGVAIPLIFRVNGPQFAPALIQWLKGGRCA
ncbi:HPr kinase/phosphorylase [Celeribacter neptunius]|uniref:HPr kinase/phosphorylase n=1 Tax=Celeribacter neptunius TaxID=588602 RepID=A0A1I3X3R8_9RHOB|nr:HPr kinase/phosphatase C-terminal domain-containing protein [Celeribacter neptunius]SFK14462.1 HPr kinase/phosphorylase [Celeribacter neptunius]